MTAQGFFVQRMISQVHSCHLDDAPDLRSCNVILKATPGSGRLVESEAGSPAAPHFYGRGNHPRVRYVPADVRLDYGKANESECVTDGVVSEVQRIMHG